ncbi:MAG: SURF1 family protein [Gammaproteobacteria bacterium]
MLRHILLPVLFSLACAGLAGLGLWQLSRAEAKRDRYETFQARREAPAIDVDAIDRSSPAELYHWRNVKLDGHYRDVHLLLDNRVRGNRAGYEVLTPFVTAGGLTVLVNRGWIPLPGSRTDIPNVTVANDPFSVRGYAGPPPVVGIDLGAGGAAPEWLAPQIIRVQRIDFDSLPALLDGVPWPAIVYLAGGAPGALDAEWPLPGDGSARHTAYAVQWFTMAAVLAAIGLWNWHRSRRSHV